MRERKRERERERERKRKRKRVRKAIDDIIMIKHSNVAEDERR